jgi:signal-transduction protein with cAMP-binding, CBS, and nucleotidyltransferase domain
MPIIDPKSVLRELTVQEAMRKLVIRVPYRASLEQATRLMIKHKVNAILVTSEEETGIGVLSKTDLMGAYYAEMPIEMPTEAVMTGPPLFCNPDESLDAALEVMRARAVHRLYVSGEMPGKAIGVLAYPDIVGILYRYCYRCERSLTGGRGAQSDISAANRLRVHEVMTTFVHAHDEDVPLFQVMEGLSSYHLGAALITGKHGRALGIISKTDLIIAYRHGVSPAVQARAIMKSPVIACSHNDLLYTAIQTMIFSDLHRLFIYRDDPSQIAGVLSLTDAARVRSGTCRACMATRVKVGGAPV